MLISIYLTLLLPPKFFLSPLSSSEPLFLLFFFKPLSSFLSFFLLSSLAVSCTFILLVALALLMALAVTLVAALAAASSLYCLLTLGLTPYLKALACRRLNQNLRHLFTLIMSALRQL